MSFARGAAGGRGRGGISGGTSQLLEDMMASSGLTGSQKRRVRASAATKTPLPAYIPPSRYRKEKWGFDGDSGEMFGRRNYGISRKNLASIKRDTPYERDAFRPLPPKFNRDAEKDKLNFIFEQGRDKWEEMRRNSRRKRAPSPPPEDAGEEWTRRAEVEHEIREREEWLADMADLVRDLPAADRKRIQEYNATIRGEISRLREELAQEEEMAVPAEEREERKARRAEAVRKGELHELGEGAGVGVLEGVGEKSERRPRKEGRGRGSGPSGPKK